MSIPWRQNAAMTRYLLKQKIKGNKKFPLIVELEPLFACNLACPGCGKI
jgi:MoaA/NifB/PqqE/SkfB family radical SAM enzyme